MKRFFNFRPIFIIAVLFALGILIAYLSLALNSDFIYLLIIPAIVFIACLFFNKGLAFIVKHYLFVFFGIVFFIFGAFSTITLDRLYSRDAVSYKDAFVECTVKDIREYDNYYYIVLSDIKIFSGESEITTAFNAGMYYGKDGGISSYNQNDRVSFRVNISPNKYIFGGQSNRFSQIKDLKIIKDNNLGIRSLIKLKVHENLYSVMDETTAGLSYAMLFGDSNGVDDEVYNSFSTSGIVHLLAVSGLHVGFIVLVLSFIFSIAKANKKVSMIVIAVILVLYSALCGFRSSVTRATIMTIISFYAGFRGRQYDGLNALSLSAIIILVFSPYSLFTRGFLLSFSAVFGILAITPILSELLERILPKKMSSIIALSVGAQVGTLPFVISYFNKVSLVALLTNFIVVPIATIAYMFIFVITIFSLIIPITKYAYAIPKLLMRAIVYIAESVSRFTHAVIYLKTNVIASSLYFSGIIIASDYLFVKQKWMYYVPIFLICVAIILAIV